MLYCQLEITNTGGNKPLKIKNLIGIICSAAIIFLPLINCYADDEIMQSDIFYYTVSGNEATIINVDDTREDVTVPATLDNYNVVAVAEGAFGGSEKLRSVEFEEGTKHIDKMAFAYSKNLSSVVLPYSLNSIGEYAFYQCEALTSITIPGGTSSIANMAFAGCSLLLSAVVPKSVTAIGDNVFYGADYLRIYAPVGSAAELYANNYGIGFEELINVTVNGETVLFDQPPITEYSTYRTMVPIRSVVEKMGASVDWDPLINTAGISLNGNRVLIKVGADFIMVNGKAQFIDTPAIEFNNRVLIPIRAVAEGLGGKVIWDENTKAVNINYSL